MLLDMLTMRGDGGAAQQRQHRVRHPDDPEDVGVEDGADDVEVERRRVLRPPSVRPEMPALLTSTSSRPAVCSTVAAAAATLSVGGDVERRPRTRRPRRPAAARRPPRAGRRRVRRPRRVKPSAPRPCAIAKPIPLFAPVTSAVFVSFT